MDAAFYYMETNKAVLWEDYPYLAKDGACRQSEFTGHALVQSYTDVTPKNADALKAAIA